MRLEDQSPLAAPETGVISGCPRCGTATLTFAHGNLGESACSECGGRFIPASGVERLVHQRLGVSQAMLRELLGFFGGERLECPGCESKTSPVRLGGVDADLCSRCGGLWLDRAELTAMTKGELTG